MSALPPKADILGGGLNVRFVPKADIGRPPGSDSHRELAATLQRHPTVCLARFQTTDAAVPAPKECTDKDFKLTLVPYEELCD